MPDVYVDPAEVPALLASRVVPLEPRCALCGVEDMGGSLVEHWAACPRCGAVHVVCRRCGGYRATLRWCEAHTCRAPSTIPP